MQAHRRVKKTVMAMTVLVLNCDELKMACEEEAALQRRVIAASGDEKLDIFPSSFVFQLQRLQPAAGATTEHSPINDVIESWFWALT